MKKKLLGLMLSVFILVPTFASAKMIDIGNDTYLNTDYIVVIKGEKKGCAVYLGMEAQSLRGITGKYMFDTSCKNFLQQYDIDLKQEAIITSDTIKE